MSEITTTAESSWPRHIAIIMDGNGRWAQQRRLPRTLGHQEGVKAVRKTVDFCARQGIDTLTLFAFSSENWRRPEEEVSTLMSLFLATLQRETDKLRDNNIRLRFIGDRRAFDAKLQQKIADAEQQTAPNTGLRLVIAANYGGRWDITQAAQRIASEVASGALAVEALDEAVISRFLATAEFPEPDLFIRTGGEMRLSNFLLWQLAYTELYFTPTLWPDFDEAELQRALHDYAQRQRRFGLTSDQVNPV